MRQRCETTKKREGETGGEHGQSCACHGGRHAKKRGTKRRSDEGGGRGRQPSGEEARQCSLDITFPPPPLKFRTAGFPQYGFKPALDRNLRCLAHTRRAAYRRPGVAAFCPCSPRGQSIPGDGERGDCRDEPIQRPLARQRVMLSRRVRAYYGLIRVSGPHPPAYLLRPADTWRPRGSRLSSAHPSFRAICLTPAGPAAARGCCLAADAALAIIRVARHPRFRAEDGSRPAV